MNKDELNLDAENSSENDANQSLNANEVTVDNTPETLAEEQEEETEDQALDVQLSVEPEPLEEQIMKEEERTEEIREEVDRPDEETVTEVSLPEEEETETDAVEEAIPAVINDESAADAAKETPEESIGETEEDVIIKEEKPDAATTPAASSGDESEEHAEEEHDEGEEESEVEAFIKEDDDLAEFSKKDLLALAEKIIEAIKKPGASQSDVRNVDNVAKQIQPLFEELHLKEKADALKSYIAEVGSDDGFDFKNDNITLRFESIMADIRDTRQKFYRNLRQLRDDYFEIKTALLERLRHVVDEEEKGGSKENWAEFKKIQEEWKDAGNVNSPHNGSLWSAYNALVDRYFDIRSIQNELKDLDRRKNLELKSDIVTKIEEIAEQIKNEGYSGVLFKQGNEHLDEYKSVGPAPREEQDALWERVKAAFDVVYDKKREAQESNQKLQQEVLAVKKQLVDKLTPFAEFVSGSINEWNAKTKEVLAIQDQWNDIKGQMPKEEGKQLSKQFWGNLKQFFKGKSAFFAQLEAEREENLKAKEALCVEIENLLAAADTNADNTNRVIELQKTWRTIGHVPHKQKDSIYERFKKAADAYFNLKRSENAEVEKEYVENLQAKEAVCKEVEDLVKSGDIDLSKLSDFKARYNAIGFVPRKNMKSIQKRFVDAINEYVRASSDLSKRDEEKLLLKNQVDVTLKGGGGTKSLNKQENDLRRKAKSLEDDISLWRNNIEFFGHSKGAEKMKADFEKKIVKAEKELEALNEKIRLFSIANEE